MKIIQTGSRRLGSMPAFLLCCLVLLLPASPVAQETTVITRAMLETALAENLSCLPLDLVAIDSDQPLLENRNFCLTSLYRETGLTPLWVDIDGPGANARLVFERLRRASAEGLEPEHYEVERINALWKARTPEELAQLDTLLSFNLVRYIHDLSFGQLKLNRAAPELYAEAGNPDFNPVQALLTALEVVDIGSYLDRLAPQHHYYLALKSALARYRELARTTSWTTVPDGPLIRPGGTDPRLAAVVQRLGEEHPDTKLTVPERYDDSLVSAVRRFQASRGLNPDGIIGPHTRAALNQGPAELAEIIRANLARWRWQDHQLPDTYLMVNIAAFTVTAIRDHQTVLTLPVIVGKFQHQTPVFSDSIRYLEFNPFWNIPPAIARNEELPALRKNPQHLVERNIRLFSSWQNDAVELDSTSLDWNAISRAQMSRFLLRQDPGPWNALGQVKFVFPNHHAVYLHDTPGRTLFQETTRSFSHGCIRVSQPLLLALFCLQQNRPDWTLGAIEHLVASNRRTVIPLRERLPIFITYQTAWVDSDGQIRFNADIYQRDARLLQALDAKPSSPR